jgi:thymidylate kinase
LKYLKDKERLYEEMAKEYDLKIIDGNRNQEEVFEEVRNLSR